MLAENPGALEIQGTWLNQREGQGLMFGTGFRTEADPRGKTVAFWGIKSGDRVRIFRAVRSGDAWECGNAIEVMANREGRAVTADYDLALVAPRVESLGPEHTSPMKMTSFEEVAARTRARPEDTGVRVA